LFRAIRHGRSDHDVICPRPFRERDLKRRQQRAEKRGPGAAGQFLDFGGLRRRNRRKPSSWGPG
jgi:hypothetical protein